MSKIFILKRDLPWAKAGTEWEFHSNTLDGVRLIANKNGDYTHEFPKSTFQEWFKEKFFPGKIGDITLFSEFHTLEEERRYCEGEPMVLKPGETVTSLRGGLRVLREKKPSVTFTKEQVEAITNCIKNSGVSVYRVGEGSCADLGGLYRWLSERTEK